MFISFPECWFSGFKLTLLRRFSIAPNSTRASILSAASSEPVWKWRITIKLVQHFCILWSTIVYAFRAFNSFRRILFGIPLRAIAIYLVKEDRHRLWWWGNNIPFEPVVGCFGILKLGLFNKAVFIRRKASARFLNRVALCLFERIGPGVYLGLLVGYSLMELASTLSLHRIS